MAKDPSTLIKETTERVRTVSMHGPYNTPAVTSAGVRAIGEAVDARGADSDTMFGEGSVGKVRFAGLAYMLHQDRLLDMDEKVTDYFSKPEVKEFLRLKYGGDISGDIIDLFSREDNKDGTLADLTTHHSGVGDNIMTNFGSFHREGIEGQWPLPKQIAAVNREDGKVRAMNRVVAEYGRHQYSNLGYMILGDVMEAALNKGVTRSEDLRTYKDEMKSRMLGPLGLTATKFPEDLTESDKVARSYYSDPSGKVVDTTVFQGAGSAGGMFATSDDIQKYFTEFFRGFPGTPEHGVDRANRLFSKETIQKMVEEWEKHKPAGITPSGNKRYQAPGFTAEIDPRGKVVSYDKTGGTFGYDSHMLFYPATGIVDIKMTASENVSPKALEALPKSLAERILKQQPVSKAHRLDRPLMQENITAYLKQHYAPHELQFSGHKIVQAVSEDIKAHGGMIPKVKVPLLNRDSRAELLGIAAVCRSVGVKPSEAAVGVVPVESKKVEKGREGRG